MPFHLPALPIPEPLRGNEIGSFAHYTVNVRMPEIGREVIETNRFTSEVVKNLEALIAEIPSGKIRPLQDIDAPDATDWLQYVIPSLGLNWLDIPWFFAETYFYRRILEATGYFSAGLYRGYDPYGEQKRRSLSLANEAIQTFYNQVWTALIEPEPSTLERLLVNSLWGNQADLSVWSIDEDDRPDYRDEVVQTRHLVINEAEQAADICFSTNRPLQRVDFLMDNCGQELACDLGLVFFLLESGLAKTVHLYLKPHPTFVSDATAKDVVKTLETLSTHTNSSVAQIAKRLASYLEEGRLHLREHFFWTSPLPLWEMPPDLRNELGQASLIISKGDLNYRRLIGDRHWSFVTPFEQVVAYLPTSLLALRVLKAECVVGLSEEKIESLTHQDPDWLFDGKWGVIQLYPKRDNPMDSSSKAEDRQNSNKATDG